MKSLELAYVASRPSPPPAQSHAPSHPSPSPRAAQTSAAHRGTRRFLIVAARRPARHEAGQLVRGAGRAEDAVGPDLRALAVIEVAGRQVGLRLAPLVGLSSIQ